MIIMHKFIFSSLLCAAFLLPSLQAQNTDWQWAQTSGSAGDEAAMSLCIDASGNTYIVGNFTNSISIGTTTLLSAGGQDAFLAKFSPTGAPLWAAGIAGVGEENAVHLVCDASGIYLTGDFEQTANFFNAGGNSITRTSAGAKDIFAAKYDSDGNVVWVSTVGGSGNDVANAIDISPSGAVYISSHIGSDFNFGSSSIVASAPRDVFVAKFNSAGTALWARSASTGGASSWGSDIEVDDNNESIYLTGAFNGNLNIGSDTTLNSSNYDAFLMHYDSAGTLQWAQKMGGSGHDYGHRLRLQDNDLFLIGHFQSPTFSIGSTTLNNAGGQDAYFAKFDLAGIPLLTKSIGSTGTDWGMSLDIDANGDILFAGSFSNSITVGSATASSAGDLDLFLAKYEGTSGNFLRLHTAGGTGEDYVTDMQASADKIRFTGSFQNTINFDTIQRTSLGAKDLFLAEIGNDVNISVQETQEFQADEVYLFPNPNGGTFTLQAPQMQAIQLLDAQGRILHSQQFDSPVDAQQISLPALAAGYYLLRVQTPKGFSTQRVVIYQP